MNLEELRKIINEYKNKINFSGISINKLQQNKLLFKEVNNKYNNLFKSISEIIYLAKNYNSLENLHIFCYCGNKNNFININKGYHKYCSIKCRSNDNNYNNKIKQVRLNNINKNGLNSYQLAAIKSASTMKSIIDENGLNIYQKNKIKEVKTKFKLYKNIALKIKNAKLNNIDENGLNSFQRGSIKAANTMKNIINKNGLNGYQYKYLKMKNNIDENGLNTIERSINKAKNTKLNNIDENGLNSFQRAGIKAKNAKLNNIDENGLNSFQRGIIKQKQTCLEKYGVNHYFKSQEFKDKFKNKEWLFKVKRKEYLTKKKNNSFNTSKDEEQVYNYLLQKFNKDDIERQYRSEEYPFNCDFYIRSLDLYIECNFHWTHNNHPFDKNSIKDLQELEELKNKNSKYYNNMIYTWTNLDVRKLDSFKKNKLNYKIFYNIEQFLSWYKDNEQQSTDI